MADSIRVAGYVRVSTAEQGLQGSSLGEQRAQIERYCVMRGLTLAQTFEDVCTGARALATRPAGRGLVQLATQGAFDGVIACHLDRLFRDCVDCLTTADAWAAKGVALHLVDVGGQALNTSTPTGRFLLTALAGAAEFSRAQTAARTSTVLRHKAQNGEYTGGRAPYGYGVAASGDRLRLVENPEEQAVVAHVRALRAAGGSFRRIARQLEREGHVGRTGRAFALVQIQRMLER